jgi:hemoglobin
MSKRTFVPPGGPPQTQRPDPAIFEAMGEENINRMIHDFYAELEKSSIRGLFPSDMSASADRSAAFFIGLLGGPPRYQERYGEPMLRARHMPFPIDAAAREVWLGCFKRVLSRSSAAYSFPSEHLAGFVDFLGGFSLWMVNTE